MACWFSESQNMTIEAVAARADATSSGIERFARAMTLEPQTACVISAASKGRQTFVIARAIAPLSMTPPALLVSLAEKPTRQFLSQVNSHRFCVNLLSTDNAHAGAIWSALSDPIGSKALQWHDGPFEIPYLEDAQANIFCERTAQIFVGSHASIVAAVLHSSQRTQRRP